MAKVHHRKARKDYLDAGVKKGDMYYYVSIKTGPRSSRIMRQLTPFKPAQLTSSEYLKAVYGIEESLSHVTDDSDIQEIIMLIEELRDETQEKFDNMPDGLQQGDTGQMLEERIGQCDDSIQELETIISELGDNDDVDDDLLEQAKNISIG